MRAVVFDQFGAPDVLHVATIDRPEPAADEVLVKVKAVAVNHVDTFIRSGGFQTNLATPHVAGRDLVGTVVAVGEHVQSWQVGDAVWANSLGYDGRMGATAEYVVVPAERAYPLPTGIDPIQLVASVHSAATAAIVLQSVMQAQAGQRLLVEGAAGNVGRKLIQLGHQRGLTVVTTSAPRDFERCQALGSTQTVNYAAGFESHFQLADQRFDHIIDTSGKVALATNLGLLKQAGQVTLITAPKTNQFTFPVRQFYTQQQRISGFVISHATQDQLATAAQWLNHAFAAGLLLDDQVSVQPFEAAAACHAQLEQGQDHGQRLVLVPSK